MDKPRERATSSSPVAYREKLRPPWWWYPVAVACASVLAAEFHIGGIALTDWVPWATLLPLSIVIVWSFGRSELAIRDGELSIRDAHIPLRFVSGAVGLDANTLRRVVGREGDPRAYIAIRPWIGPGVQVWIDDPEDPTPYWVVSSRRAEELVARLRPTG